MPSDLRGDTGTSRAKQAQHDTARGQQGAGRGAVKADGYGTPGSTTRHHTECGNLPSGAATLDNEKHETKSLSDTI